MLLRPLEPDDMPAARRLFLAARADTFTWIGAERRLEDFDEQTRGEAVVVAVVDGDLAGFVSVWEPDDFIHHLYVSAGHRGQGVGRALLEAVPGWGARPFTLKCLTRNTAALGFYLSRGFTEVERKDGPDGEFALLRSPVAGEHSIQGNGPPR